MHFDRLVLDQGVATAGEHRIVELHPRLTVVCALSQTRRDALMDEFLGALGGARPGAHLELTADDGRRFAIFRPHGAPQRMIDVDERADVTARFVGPDGRVDLLALAGLDPRVARQAMCCTAGDLAGSTDRDPDSWPVPLGSGPNGGADGGAAVVQRVEQCHEDWERSRTHTERARTARGLVVGAAVVAALPVLRLVGPAAVMPLVMVALSAVVVSWIARRRSDAARRAEIEALAAVGAQSYLGFHLQRINTLVPSHNWAGRATAADDAAHDHEQQAGDSAAITRAVLARLADLEDLGGSGECFPALFDEPFTGVGAEALPSFLELLVDRSRHQQIVLLTESPTIASWARVEAMTGAVGIIDPGIIDPGIIGSGSTEQVTCTGGALDHRL